MYYLQLLCYNNLIKPIKAVGVEYHKAVVQVGSFDGI